jgi:hypothetical protein
MRQPERKGSAPQFQRERWPAGSDLDEKIAAEAILAHLAHLALANVELRQKPPARGPSWAPP